jgi:hypothetical protein
MSGSVERTADDHGQIERDERRLTAEVPLLDWPADLFTRDAAIVDIMVEDCSFRFDSPAVWYGNHLPPMYA